MTSLELPNITDRLEAPLFNWEGFEIAGGLDKLPEGITTRGGEIVMMRQEA